VAAETVTAALMNTHVRDNLLETGPAKVTTNGDIIYATAANALARLGIGSANDALVVSGGIPAWSAANYIVRHTATAKVRIQSTRAALNSGNPCSKDTKYSYAWTFPTAFSATPVVVGIIECSETTDPPTVESDIHTVGTTAATINAYFTSSGSPTPTLYAHIIAVGAIA
jgi:hypothetical protein